MFHNAVECKKMMKSNFSGRSHNSRCQTDRKAPEGYLSSYSGSGTPHRQPTGLPIDAKPQQHLSYKQHNSSTPLHLKHMLAPSGHSKRVCPQHMPEMNRILDSSMPT